MKTGSARSGSLPHLPSAICVLASLVAARELAWDARADQVLAVTTIAGAPGQAGSTDGTAGSARFNSPVGIGVLPSGDLVVADFGNETVRKVTPLGVVTTIAGIPGVRGSENGSLTPPKAHFNTPYGVTIDPNGLIVVAGLDSCTVKQIDLVAGLVSTVAGSYHQSAWLDGVGTAARFRWPGGIDVDSSGNLYLVDISKCNVRKITPDGTVSTIAGNGGTGSLEGVRGYADGVGISALFKNPHGLAIGGAGLLFVTDTENHVIRTVTVDGVVGTFAGVGMQAGSADGAGSGARFREPHGIAADGFGNLYVADTANHTIRKVTSGGVVTTIAGLAGSSGTADGSGSAARFLQPEAIALDASGCLWITANHSVRKGVLSPAVETHPAGGTVVRGNAANMSVQVSGTAPFEYRWRKDGAFLDGAVSATLTLTNVQSSDAGAYDVVITNSAGSVTSASAALSVQVPPSITGHPVGATVNWGQPVAFSVTATGTIPLSYQWKKDGVNIGGAIGPTLDLPVAMPADAGVYSVTVSNSLGLMTSSGATLTVRQDVPPTVVTQPTGGAVTSLSPVNLGVQAVGPGPFAYQWRLNGVDIPGANTAFYSVPSAQLFDSGGYTVTVTNVFGSATSSVATVTVNRPASSGARLVNISTRGSVGTGGDLLIAGFVVSDEGPMTCLIRAVGPGLAAHGVSGFLADPQLAVYQRGNLLFENDDWGTSNDQTITAQLSDLVYAFALSSGSKDAAIVVTLPPGIYTVHAFGKGGSTGVGLVEVYEVP